MLCSMPSTTNPSSASDIASMACSPRRRPGAELCDHRIVEHRDFRAFRDAGVVADDDVAEPALPRAGGTGQAADRGQEIAVRILGIEAAFHRPAVQLHVLLPDRELFAGGDPDHLLDQIDAGDELGHRMLDLQTRIHFKEIEVLVRVDDELDGAGALVVDGLGQRHRLLAHGAPRRLVEKRRRRLLDDLLVAALDRAFALAEIDAVAVRVAQHLDLDVARIDDELSR